ncbi:MAG: hypothetical protein OEZ39_07750 [Gammaproteobacteria bacterium]|nr:hypothetical protein [Gammaproteobacteria bacterium]MDH5651753.1 hypothetical protein [Gammaproteobacteria bacterium]
MAVMCRTGLLLIVSLQTGCYATNKFSEQPGMQQAYDYFSDFYTTTLIISTALELGNVKKIQEYSCTAGGVSQAGASASKISSVTPPDRKQLLAENGAADINAFSKLRTATVTVKIKVSRPPNKDENLQRVWQFNHEQNRWCIKPESLL